MCSVLRLLPCSVCSQPIDILAGEMKSKREPVARSYDYLRRIDISRATIGFCAHGSGRLWAISRTTSHPNGS
jgi:hypothetical protein